MNDPEQDRQTDEDIVEFLTGWPPATEEEIAAYCKLKQDARIAEALVSMALHRECRIGLRGEEVILFRNEDTATRC
jgi:hypothetical protein